MNERQVFAALREMRAWVAREQKRLAKTGERPSQTYLRRSRLLIDLDLLTLRELLRELRAFQRKSNG